MNVFLKETLGCHAKDQLNGYTMTLVDSMVKEANDNTITTFAELLEDHNKEQLAGIALWLFRAGTNIKNDLDNLTAAAAKETEDFSKCVRQLQEMIATMMTENYAAKALE